MLQAAQTAALVTWPKEVERVIKQFTESKMNWREVLQTQIKDKNDYTFIVPSRKAWHTGAVLPGTKNDETIDVCIAIDTSGSIRDEQVKALGEVQTSRTQYADYNIKIWCFDTNNHNEQDYSAHDDSIENYKIAGGGGTDFMANWEYMKENGIESKSLSCSQTDTHGIPWGRPDYCDTVFVVHEHHDKNPEASFWYNGAI